MPERKAVLSSLETMRLKWSMTLHEFERKVADLPAAKQDLFKMALAEAGLALDTLTAKIADARDGDSDDWPKLQAELQTLADCAKQQMGNVDSAYSNAVH